MAFIQLIEGFKASQEEIMAYCAWRVPGHEIPSYIIFVSKYPTTGCGKVQRYRLRKQAEETLGVGE